jgi:RNAse (barnase) inhibitor barstar
MGMREIVLDGSNWRSVDDFYAALLPALGAPDSHGRDLDALSDSLRGGELTQVDPPLAITISGIYTMAPDVERLVRSFADLADALATEGTEISVEIAP